MEFLGIWLAGVGLADVIAGPESESRLRRLAGVAGGTITALILLLLVGADVPTVIAMLGLTAASLCAWVLPRGGRRIGSAASLAVVTGVAGLLVVGAELGRSSGEPLSRALESAAVPSISERPYQEVVLIFGAGLWLVSSANVVVRLILSAAGTPVAFAQTSIKGGRFIGPIERLMIFGFALVGELTAAALVVSAKSLLRWPEISVESRRASAAIHDLTEYLVVGSLSSWFLALVPGALLA